MLETFPPPFSMVNRLESYVHEVALSKNGQLNGKHVNGMNGNGKMNGHAPKVLPQADVRSEIDEIVQAEIREQETEAERIASQNGHEFNGRVSQSAVSMKELRQEEVPNDLFRGMQWESGERNSVRAELIEARKDIVTTLRHDMLSHEEESLSSVSALEQED